MRTLRIRLQCPPSKRLRSTTAMKTINKMCNGIAVTMRIMSHEKKLGGDNDFQHIFNGFYDFKNLAKINNNMKHE